MPRIALLLVVGLLAYSDAGKADDVIPRAAVDPPPLAVSAEYVSGFSRMLDTGYARGTANLDAALRQSESLQRARPDDPRVEYGAALCLLKNFRQSDAATHVAAALERDPAYLPARQAQVRDLLQGKKFEEVNQRLLALADVIGLFSQAPPPLPVRQAAAEWMGRVTGFLEGPLGDIDAQKATELTTAKLRVGLGPELRPSFEAGRVALSVAHRKLQDEEREATAVASAAKQKKLEESQTKSDELGGARERLELTRDQWDAWVKEQVGEIDSQLAALEKRYNAAESDLRAITDSISLNRLEVQRLLAIVQQLLSLSQQALSTAQRNAGNRRFSVDIDLGSVQAQLAARQAELDQLSAQYNETEQERGAVLQSAQGLLVNRQSSLNRYQEATGQAAKRIRQIKQWDQRLKNESEKLARMPDRKAQSVTAVRKRMRTWSTYEDFTIDAEKVRLLAEFEIAQP